MKKGFLLILSLYLLFSCQESKKDKMFNLLKEWIDKEIIFPPHAVFTVQGKDTVDLDLYSSNYKIVVYTDSTGCISCKLKLHKWKEFMQEIASLHKQDTDLSYVFFFNSKDRKELQFLLRQDSLIHPVCLDEKDEFNKLNHFPSEDEFKVFLLNKNNKVIAVGNPIHNPKVKELYIKLLIDEMPLSNRQVLTTAELDLDRVNFGIFVNTEKQEQIVTLKNTGKELLIIQGTSTSCGCTKVEFEKKPIPVGSSAMLKIIHTAEESGHFSKTIDVYCNITSSPLRITVTGKVIK